MNTVRYVQQVEFSLIINPSTTVDNQIVGSSDYPVIVDFLSVSVQNSANPFTGGSIRCLVYVGYATGFFDRIPTTVGGNVLSFSDNVPRVFYLLPHSVYLEPNRYLRVYINNTSTSLTQHASIFASYSIV